MLFSMRDAYRFNKSGSDGRGVTIGDTHHQTTAEIQEEFDRIFKVADWLRKGYLRRGGDSTDNQDACRVLD